MIEYLGEIFEAAGVTATPAQMEQIGNDIKDGLDMERESYYNSVATSRTRRSFSE